MARELDQLGFDAKPIGTGRILFSTENREQLLRAIVDANLWLRAADRVLIRLADFPVGGGDEGFETLYQTTMSLPWEDWIHPSATFPVAGRSVRSLLSSEPALQRTVKRAIVERLRKAHALSPGVPLPEIGPRVAIEISILNDHATLTIDTSGIGLHKRGYRAGLVGEAALKETLAAGLVLLSVWRPGRPLVDPFCGSGTIAIEAAMLARAIAPGLLRDFDAQYWWAPRSSADGPTTPALIDPRVWEDAREEARAAIVPDRLDPIIHASDTSDDALRLARVAARNAGVEQDIQFLKRPFAELASRIPYGVVITNPPYGVRLDTQGTATLDQLYRSMPMVFRNLPTWSFHVFTGRLDLESLFGQPAAKRRKLYNSTLECTYFSFLGPKPTSNPPTVRPPTSSPATSSPATSSPAISSPATSSPTVREGFSSDLPNPPDHITGENVDITPDDLTLLDREANKVFEDMVLDGPEAFAPGDAKLIGDAPPAPPTPPPRHSASPPLLSSSPGPAFGGLTDRERRDAEDFGRCIAKNLRHLRRYPTRGIHCFRVYERDVPDVPLIIDRYHDHYHAVEYERPHGRTATQQADWFDLMRRTLAQVAEVPLDHIHLKEKHRQRGLSQHEKLADARHTLLVREGDPALTFEVNLTDYVDTGLFLDQRLTREMVREQAADKRVLNLFCYTGSFSVYAAAGGAKTVTSVDLSNTYLAWTERNLGLNRLWSKTQTLVRADVLDFLREQPPTPAFDLVIADPPTFSNSKSTEMDWEVGTAHADMLRLLAPLLTTGGVIYFSNNFRRFKLDEIAVAAAGLVAREISKQTIPPEYRNTRIHRCWRITKQT